MRPPAPSGLRQNLLCGVLLGLLFLTSPVPALQAILHAMLVLALAPRPAAPLTGALWAIAAGWAVEGSLRLYPHLGGTAWADLTLVLLVGWAAGRWPVEGAKSWLLRLGAFSLLHLLVVHGAVRLAAGPHPWGYSVLWVLATLPLWGWLAWRLLHAVSTPGRR